MTPFQKGHDTDLPAFQWLAQQPKLFAALQQVMTAMQSDKWLTDFGLLSKATAVLDTAPNTHEKPFFVDVGGGHGHQCIQLLEKYPSLRGRLVLQDLPQAVEKLPAIDGVRVMAQDFFEKQSIRGTLPPPLA